MFHSPSCCPWGVREGRRRRRKGGHLVWQPELRIECGSRAAGLPGGGCGPQGRGKQLPLRKMGPTTGKGRETCVRSLSAAAGPTPSLPHGFHSPPRPSPSQPCYYTTPLPTLPIYHMSLRESCLAEDAQMLLQADKVYASGNNWTLKSLSAQCQDLFPAPATSTHSQSASKNSPLGPPAKLTKNLNVVL